MIDSMISHSSLCIPVRSLIFGYSLILTIIAKDSVENGVLIIKTKTSNMTTNKLLHDKFVLNTTIIHDNSVKKTAAPSKTLTDFYMPTVATNSSIIIFSTVKYRGNANSKSVLLGRTFMSTTTSTKAPNFTTAVPTHPMSEHSHTNEIIQYVFIPLGCVVFIIALLFLVRHIQRVKKKRRLERELLHQYSYPNSEAGDIDEEDRLLEVESVINSQFNILSDQEEKNFVDEIPQVSVAFGEGSKLVLQDTQSPTDNVEASTSFNC